MLLNYKKTCPNAVVPTYGTDGAAGSDMYACLEAPVTILPGEKAFISTGIAVELPNDYAGLLLPRSGLACKRGLTLANAPGLIDSDYRGTITCCIINHGREPQTISHGERIAQFVVTPVVMPAYNEVDALSDTARGHGGFGSTGR